MVRALLAAPGCMDSANDPNDRSQYPMHFAAFQRHAAVVRVMLDAGMDTMVLDRKGRTPAEDTTDEAIRQMILDSRS